MIHEASAAIADVQTRSRKRATKGDQMGRLPSCHLSLAWFPSDFERNRPEECGLEREVEFDSAIESVVECLRVLIATFERQVKAFNRHLN